MLEQVYADQEVIKGANHFFETGSKPMLDTVAAYLDRRLIEDQQAKDAKKDGK